MELTADVIPAAMEITPSKLLRTGVPSLSRRRILVALTMAVVLGCGAFFRVYPSAGHDHLGTDERGYMVFVKQIQAAGVWNYDAVIRVYLERQNKLPEAVVPATRVGFLAPAAVVADLFHLRAFTALHATAAAAGILLLLLTALFAYRLGGTIPMIGTTALVASAPLQIYLSQRAMIDGYFALWAVAALWLAWENLQRPRHAGWLTAYALSLTMLVLTKETAAFVVFALFLVLLLNRLLRVGTVTPSLLAATVLGPLLGALLLVMMIGGLGESIHFYATFAAKSQGNWYSVVAQDGPWYRYAIDFALVSPVIVALACGRIFQLRKKDHAGVFLATFTLLALAGMSCLKYGISLRYAAFCEVPLCWLAFAQVQTLSHRFVSVRPAVLGVCAVLVLSAIGFHQYVRLFVRGKLYDPTTSALVWSSGMEKELVQKKGEPSRGELFPAIRPLP